MVIEKLSQYPMFQEPVIAWINKEFGTGKSFRFYAEIVGHSTDDVQFPATFVAVEDGNLLGTVGLWRGDLLSRQDLFPWCSALFVNPAYRNRGIGTALQNHALLACKERGFHVLYLYSDLAGYYEKNGWEAFAVGYEYTGAKMTIYRHPV